MKDCEKFKLAKLEGHVAIWGNVALFIFKFFVGMATSSVAIMADAWHTLSDSLSSIVLLFGIKIAEKPADEKHPFGHGRAEIIATFIIGMMLIGIGVEFGITGISKLLNPDKPIFGWLAISAMIITIFVKELMAQLAYWIFRKTGLESLKADGHHHRSDAISSVIVLCGIGIDLFFNGELKWMDGFLAIVVSVIILFAAWKVLSEAANTLMGVAPNGEIIKQINEICCLNYQENVRPHHIHLHQYGSHCELSMHIDLPGAMSLQDAHEIARKIEEEILEKLKMETTIHTEPKK